jgi:hypothetical protein
VQGRSKAAGHVEKISKGKDEEGHEEAQIMNKVTMAQGIRYEYKMMALS